MTAKIAASIASSATLSARGVCVKAATISTTAEWNAIVGSSARIRVCER